VVIEYVTSSRHFDLIVYAVWYLGVQWREKKDLNKISTAGNIKYLERDLVENKSAI